MAETQERTIDFSEIDFPKFQQKIEPLKDENMSLLELGISLEKYNTTNLTETEKAALDLFVRIAFIRLTKDAENASEVRFPLGMENITNYGISFFTRILNDVINKMLKARIADILWTRRKDSYDAVIVINTYLSISFDAPNFIENLRCWIRGIYVAQQIKNYDPDILKSFEQKALNYLLSDAKFEEDYCAFELIKLLRLFGLCSEQKYEIIKKAIKWGDKLKNVNCFLAELYYNEASLWADSQKQSDKHSDEYVKLQVKRVEANINEANKSKSGIMALTHNENALKILQRLPKKQYRQYFSVKKKKALIRNRKLSGKKSLPEMDEIYLSFNPSKAIEQIHDNFKGRDKQTALCNFAFVVEYISVKELEKNAFHYLKENPIELFLNTTILGSDGRIIGNVPGIDFDISKVNSKTPVVENNMIQQYMQHIFMVVNAAIYPALQIIRCEHNIQLSDIMMIVQKSNLIPQDRVEVFAKGLYAGFSDDFMTALHLLMPQIENMVRIQLQKAEIVTSKIKEEVEIENSLSGLVKNEKFEDVFGQNLSFEFKALFGDGAALNLRNNVAHGLLSSNEMKSVYVIYFWWFCFRLVYHGFNTEKTEVKK